MRFIVDVYRYLTLGGIALMIIALVYIALRWADLGAGVQYAGLIFGAGIGLILLIVVALGMTATFISIHDRHAELVDEIRDLRITIAASETRHG